MAINFPDTSGQPTNGSYTFTVSGTTYSWDGESWNALGSTLTRDLGELTDVDLTTAPTTGEVLKYNGTVWTAATDAEGGAALSNIADSAQGVDVTGRVAAEGLILSTGGQIDAAGCSVDFQSATISFSGASIGGLAGEIKDVTIITWTLTANGTTDYVFSGNGFPTSQNDPDLYLVRGETYRFFNNTGGHPFRIQSTTATSGGGTKYDSGVQNSDGTVNDAGNGVTLTFVVPMDAPDTLYYQCTSHPDMFGTINVLSAGSSGSIAIGDDDGTKTTSLKIGDDADLTLSYDGTAGVQVSFIESDALIIRTKSTPNENYITCLKDGPVELYYDDVKKLSTSSQGISVVGTVTDNKGELRTLPLNEKFSDYTLVTDDAGKAVFFTASTGTITIPNGVFSPGHLITIINDTGTTQSIVQGTGLTMYYTADGSTGNRQATQRSSTTILFKDTSIAYISGTGLS
jgi:hypothetical protein